MTEHKEVDVATFLAFGSRGDVQPLAILARLYSKVYDVSVRFVSHEEHRSFLSTEIFSSASKITLYLCDTPPILPHGSEERYLWTETQSNTCIKACLGDTSSGRGIAKATGLIAFNLFAMEGLVIADTTGIPAAGLHPYPLPRQSSAPRDLRQRLRSEWPSLLNDLDLASAIQDQQGQSRRHQNFGNSSSEYMGLTYEEFEHWVWPIVLLPQWRHFRSLVCARLSRHQQRQHHALWACKERAPPLMYGHAPLLLPRPGYWHPRISVRGPWVFPAETAADSEVLPSEIEAFLLDSRVSLGPLVYVNLGVAWVSGVIPKDLFPVLSEVLVQAIRRQKARAIIHLPSSTSVSLSPRAVSSSLPPQSVSSSTLCPTARIAEDLKAAFEEAILCVGNEAIKDDIKKGDILIWCKGSIPHDTLFQALAALPAAACIHHGGSGTTLACAMSGLVQILLPCFFDQFVWAERCHYLNLAPSPLSVSAFLVPSLRLRKQEAQRALESRLAIALFDTGLRREAAAFGKTLRDSMRGSSMCSEKDEKSAVNEAMQSSIESTVLCLQKISHLRQYEPLSQPLSPFEQFSRVSLTLSYPPMKKQKYGLLDNNSESSELIELDLPDHSPVQILALEEAAFLINEIFQLKDYDCPDFGTTSGSSTSLSFLDGFASTLRPQRDLIIDAGANIGLFAIWISQLIHSQQMRILSQRQTGDIGPFPIVAQMFQLLCIEPNPDAVAVLRRNMRRHAPETIIVQGALVGPSLATSAAGTEEADFVVWPHLPGNSSLVEYEEERSAQRKKAILGGGGEEGQLDNRRAELLERLQEGRRKISVQTMTLTKLLETMYFDSQERGALSPESRIALLKIDVEGGEMGVLKGLSFDHWQRIDRVVAEVHLRPNEPLTEQAAFNKLLYEGLGENAIIKWCQPGWCRTNNNAASSTGSEQNQTPEADDDGNPLLDNWMVYASRR